MVNSIIEEQDLGRFNEDGSQWKKTGSDEPIDQSTSRITECIHHGANLNIGNQNEDDSQDTSREVVDQHLKTNRDLFFPQLIKLLDRPTTQRTHDHGAEEHRDVRSDNDTHRCSCPDHTAA